MSKETFLWSELIQEKRFRECVHCGFCLASCPTYRLTEREMDSPRGRIYAMNAVSSDRFGLTSPIVRHLDLCLGCRACETACPSGVRYGQIIEAGHIVVQRDARRNLMQKFIQMFFFDFLLPYPERLRLMLWPIQIWSRVPMKLKKAVTIFVPAALRPFLFLAPSPKKKEAAPAFPALYTPGKAKKKVGLLRGCVASLFFDETNKATVRVLAKNGCEVFIPKKAVCCGALPLHTGNLELAKKMARRNIDDFSGQGLDAVIVNAAGCGAAMKEYDHLLRDDPQYKEKAKEFSAKVKDITEFLVDLPFVKPTKPLPFKVTYHEACHLCHAQGIRRQPREILQAIPGLTLVEMTDSDWCCGSAGTYNLLQPEMADQLLGQKLESILATQADFVATGNPGCNLQISKGLEECGSKIQVEHPVVLLDRAYDYNH